MNRNNRLHLNAAQIINWMAVLKWEHDKVCATKGFGVCMGSTTNASHVRGHVRQNGHKNAAAAVQACHNYSEQNLYWYEAYCDEIGKRQPEFVVKTKIAIEMHRVWGTGLNVHQVKEMNAC